MSDSRPSHPYRDPVELVESFRNLPENATIEDLLYFLRLIRYAMNNGAFNEFSAENLAQMALLFETAQDEIAASISKDQDRYGWVLGVSVTITLTLAAQIPWPYKVIPITFGILAVLWAFSGLRDVRRRQQLTDKLKSLHEELGKLARGKEPTKDLVRAVMDKQEELTKTLEEDLSEQLAAPRGRTE